MYPVKRKLVVLSRRLLWETNSDKNWLFCVSLIMGDYDCKTKLKHLPNIGLRFCKNKPDENCEQYEPHVDGRKVISLTTSIFFGFLYH